MNKIALFFLKIYRFFISPLLGKNCRFYPTCSQYAEECLKGMSFFAAIFVVFRRLIKCHPWHPGGVDLPKI